MHAFRPTFSTSPRTPTRTRQTWETQHSTSLKWSGMPVANKASSSALYDQPAETGQHGVCDQCAHRPDLCQMVNYLCKRLCAPERLQMLCSRTCRFVQQTYPFYNRSGGRDHFMWFTGDRGACYASSDLGPIIRLVHFGYHVNEVGHTGCAFFNFRGW